MKSNKIHALFQEALRSSKKDSAYTEGLRILANPSTHLKLKATSVSFNALSAFKHALKDEDLELYEKLEVLVDSKVKKQVSGLFIYKIELDDVYINFDSLDPEYPSFVYEPETNDESELRVTFGKYTPPFHN